MPPRKRQKMYFPLPAQIDVPDRRCVCLYIPDEPTHIENFWGHLWTLAQWFNWDRSDGQHAAATARVWRKIYWDAHDKFDRGECCGDESDCEPTCQDFTADNAIFQYKPTDPFLTPDYVPLPYPKTPWTLGSDTILPGTEATDVLFWVQSFFGNPLEVAAWILANVPAWALDQITDYEDWIDDIGHYEEDRNLFPRFKVRFSGKGSVQLNLLKVPFGGLAFITLDGDVTSAAIVDCQSITVSDFDTWMSALSIIGLGSLTGSLTQQTIYEREIETDGDHYIDVTFIPKIDPIPTDFVIGWGGGVRKVELCGVKPIVPIPPTRENTEDECIEWLNPNTREWECIAPIKPPVIIIEPGELEILDPFEEIFNECECEECDMANCNCNSPVRYCGGKLEYRDENGQWQPVPVEALPTTIPSDEELPDDPSTNSACQKAWAAVEVATLVWRATLDTLKEQGNVQLSIYYVYWQQNHGEVDADNFRMNAIIGGLIDTGAIEEWDFEALETEYLANEAEYRQDALCKILSTMPIEGNIGDSDITRIQGTDWDFVESEPLKQIMTVALQIPETKMWKQFGYKELLQGTRQCNCTQSGDVIPPIAEGDWEYTFAFDASGSLLGWDVYDFPGFGYPSPVPSVSSLGIQAVNVNFDDLSDRKGIWLWFPIPNIQPDTIIKQLQLTYGGVTPSTNSNTGPAELIRCRVYQLPELGGDILLNGAVDDINSGSGVATFNGLAEDMPTTASMLMNIQVGHRNPRDGVPANGQVYIQRFTIRGEGTNPFE